MNKIKQSWTKNIQIYITIGTLFIGLIVSWVKFQARAEETAKKVEVVDDKVKELEKKGEEELEEVKKDNQQLDKNLTEMRVEQKYLQQSVIDLNNNVRELIQEIKEDKKLEKKNKEDK